MRFFEGNIVGVVEGILDCLSAVVEVRIAVKDIKACLLTVGSLLGVAEGSNYDKYRVLKKKNKLKTVFRDFTLEAWLDEL